jgi:hypothetical protein
LETAARAGTQRDWTAELIQISEEFQRVAEKLRVMLAEHWQRKAS